VHPRDGGQLSLTTQYAMSGCPMFDRMSSEVRILRPFPSFAGIPEQYTPGLNRWRLNSSTQERKYAWNWGGSRPPSSTSRNMAAPTPNPSCSAFLAASRASASPFSFASDWMVEAGRPLANSKNPNPCSCKAFLFPTHVFCDVFGGGVSQ